jgi:hypothetical protein
VATIVNAQQSLATTGNAQAVELTNHLPTPAIIPNLLRANSAHQLLVLCVFGYLLFSSEMIPKQTRK